MISLALAFPLLAQLAADLAGTVLMVLLAWFLMSWAVVGLLVISAMFGRCR